MKTLDQSKTITYENKLVTFVNWESFNYLKGTIKIKVLNRASYITVNYNDLHN